VSIALLENSILKDEDQLTDLVLLPSSCFRGDNSDVVEKGRTD
jgi:hypothetical protein